MSHTFDGEKNCGQNGYVCPMCQSGVFPPDYDPCPHCQHDSSDHVATPRSAGLNCTQLYVDVVTGEETFCDCMWEWSERHALPV